MMYNNGVNIIQWLSLGISCLAGTAWFAPYVYEKINKPKIKGKIMGYSMLTNGHVTLINPVNNYKKAFYGNIFLVRMLLVSLNNNFYLDTTKVNIKFKSDNKIYIGNTYFETELTSNVGDKRYLVTLSQQSNILFCPVLLKNSSCEKEFMFIVESELKDIEYIELLFYTNRAEKHPQIVKISDSDCISAIELLNHVEKKEI